MSAIGALKRALYAGGRPGLLMRLWNRLDAALFARGLPLTRAAGVLKAPGHRSGRVHAVPIALADLDGDEYIVSMLGPSAAWVRNVEAAGGQAVLTRRGRDEPVRLQLVPVPERAPILRRYLDVAPGARPHLAVHPGAPLPEFDRIAASHPVFRVHQARPKLED